MGLGRAGGIGQSSSGDLFLAFATGNHIPAHPEGGLVKLEGMLPISEMDPLLEATAEAVEEAILNALCAAETMTGQQGRTAHALPLDELKRIWEKYRG